MNRTAPGSGSLRSAYWVVFSIFYIAACSYFTVERTLFLDNAFQMFRLIQDESIVINAYRWPAAIYRLLPLIGTFLSLHLKYILWLFSLSYALVPVCGVWFIGKYLDDDKAALLLIFLCCIPLVHGFFWCNSELFLAIQLSVVFWAALAHNKWLSSTIIGICLAWLHPLVLIPVLYPLVLQAIRTKRIPLVIQSAIFIFSINYFIKSLFFKSWYDGIKQTELIQNIKQVDSDIWVSALKYFAAADHLLHAIMMLVILYLIFRRSILNVIFCLIGTYGLCVLFTLSAGKSGSLEFYSEVNNYIIYFLISYTLYFDWLEKAINIKVVPYLLASVFLLSIFRWVNASDYYQERVRWIRNTAEMNDRVLFYGFNPEACPLVLPWASAYESLLISSLSGRSKSFVFTLNEDKLKHEGNPEVFITEYRNYKLSELNKRYFNLKSKVYEIRYLD